MTLSILLSHSMGGTRGRLVPDLGHGAEIQPGPLRQDMASGFLTHHLQQQILAVDERL